MIIKGKLQKNKYKTPMDKKPDFTGLASGENGEPMQYAAWYNTDKSTGEQDGSLYLIVSPKFKPEGQQGSHNSSQNYSSTQTMGEPNLPPEPAMPAPETDDLPF